MAVRLLNLNEINRAARLANDISAACLGVSCGAPVSGSRFQVSAKMQVMVWELVELLGLKSPAPAQASDRATAPVRPPAGFEDQPTTVEEVLEKEA